MNGNFTKKVNTCFVYDKEKKEHLRYGQKIVTQLDTNDGFDVICAFIRVLTHGKMESIC